MKNPWKLIGYAVGSVIAIWLTVKFLFPIGLPFLLGFALASAAEPFVRTLTEKSRFPRWIAALLIIILLAAALTGLLWLFGRMLFGQIERFAAKIPELLSSLSGPLADLHGRLLLLAAKLPQSVAPAAVEWIDRLFEGGSVLAETASEWLISLAGNLLTLVPEIVLFLLTTLLSAYLITSERPVLADMLRKRLPATWLAHGRAVKKRLKSTIGGYVRAQLRLMGLVFLLLAAGLFLILRKPNALLIAAGIAILDALPVFGSGTALIPWGVVTLLRGNTARAVGLLLLYAVVSLSRTFLEPRFLGHQIGLHPLLTLVSLYAGYRLFGVLGMILVPVGVILVKQLYELIEPKQDINPP